MIQTTATVPTGSLSPASQTALDSTSASFSARSATAKLARTEPARLEARLTGAKLAVLATAVRVASTGPKHAVAARIVERCDLLDRMSRLGSDADWIARTFRRDSLVLYVTGLQGFRHTNKYGLAAQIIAIRDGIIASIDRELRAPRDTSATAPLQSRR